MTLRTYPNVPPIPQALNPHRFTWHYLVSDWVQRAARAQNAINWNGTALCCIICKIWWTTQPKQPTHSSSYINLSFVFKLTCPFSFLSVTSGLVAPSMHACLFTVIFFLVLRGGFAWISFLTSGLPLVTLVFHVTMWNAYKSKSSW